jgi:hypothetical protein
MRIDYVDYGIANRFADHIEINKNIKNYPKLHKFILEHELSHTARYLSWKEFLMEFDMPPMKEMLQFIAANPKEFLYECMPIKRVGNKVIYELNLLIFYALIISIAGVIYYAI